MAERSKALGLGPSLFGVAGSNPVPDTRIHSSVVEHPTADRQVPGSIPGESL